MSRFSFPSLLLPVFGVAALTGAVAAGYAQTSTVTAGPGGVSGGTTITNSEGKPCRVVEDRSKSDGSVTSSVTAGPGGTTSSSTGGNSVTVRSGDGRSSASVSTGGNGSAVVAGSGDCVVTRHPDKK
ncbi:glycosyl hydrolase [Methylobacterium durans]|uniref:glycosyl hydrolase n=1 Tax=Methylobacterium durans TaxID=2202825 RepID=UPI002AFE70A3|nr:glycosyl hydrolase [Methylobacterium durans]MEA1834519.1 glycosyl hydrolase [Methylobacterium durans]